MFTHVAMAIIIGNHSGSGANSLGQIFSKGRRIVLSKRIELWEKTVDSPRWKNKRFEFRDKVSADDIFRLRDA